MVVVFQKKPQPSIVPNGLLPGSHCGLPLAPINRKDPIRSIHSDVQIDVVECKDHAKNPSLAPYVVGHLIQRNTWGLCHGKSMAWSQHLIPHFAQEIHNTGDIAACSIKYRVGHLGAVQSLRPGLVFFDKSDRVHPETSYSLIQPPIHHVVHGMAHLGVFPIEIRLFAGKSMEVVFSRG